MFVFDTIWIISSFKGMFLSIKYLLHFICDPGIRGIFWYNSLVEEIFGRINSLDFFLVCKLGSTLFLCFGNFCEEVGGSGSGRFYKTACRLNSVSEQIVCMVEQTVHGNGQKYWICYYMAHPSDAVEHIYIQRWSQVIQWMPSFQRDLDRC